MSLQYSRSTAVGGGRTRSHRARNTGRASGSRRGSSREATVATASHQLVAPKHTRAHVALRLGHLPSSRFALGASFPSLRSISEFTDKKRLLHLQWQYLHEQISVGYKRGRQLRASETRLKIQRTLKYLFSSFGWHWWHASWCPAYNSMSQQWPGDEHITYTHVPAIEKGH